MSSVCSANERWKKKYAVTSIDKCAHKSNWVCPLIPNIVICMVSRVPPNRTYVRVYRFKLLQIEGDKKQMLANKWTAENFTKFTPGRCEVIAKHIWIEIISLCRNFWPQQRSLKQNLKSYCAGIEVINYSLSIDVAFSIW